MKIQNALKPENSMNKIACLEIKSMTTENKFQYKDQ